MEAAGKDEKKSIPKQSLIRNVCIIAHVDHGKTTIADSLVASNGHISDHSAGTSRFLDDREDEQIRGITMKTSAISLSCKGPVGEQMVINLVDTPGHIDFSTEVGAALRLCDGALIVIDILEGVCVQTKEAIKQAFDEHIKMILLINKIDRVILDLKFSLQEIFILITRIIEDCNAFIAELCQYDLCRTENEEDILFAPFMGNVIFASAIDGWGATTKQIAALIWEKCNEPSLEAYNKKLWDFDCYASLNTLKMGALQKKKPNLFITSFLKTIYHIYDTLYTRKNFALYSSIIEKLKIEKETPEMRHNDARRKVRGVFQAWSGLADIIFKQTSELIPPPTKLSLDRSKYLINYKQLNVKDGKRMLQYLSDSLNPSNPAIVYVSKMFAVNKSVLEYKSKVITGTRDREILKKEIEERKNAENDSIDEPLVEDETNSFSIIALARVFSGTIRVGQEMFILYPTYEPPDLDVDLANFVDNCLLIQKVTIQSLYILLGRNLEATKSVSVGNICGIGGLERFIRRNGTLCSTPYATPLIQQPTLEPIVWNTLECNKPSQQPLLRKALDFLQQIDSSVQVNYLQTGELVLVTAGDVHLTKCLTDIQNFASIDLKVSVPMVSLKETIISDKPKIHFNKNSSKCVTMKMEEIDLSISIMAVPIPDKIVNIVKTYFDLLNCIEQLESDSKESHEKVYSNRKVMERIKEQLEEGFKFAPWENMWKNIWSISKTHRDNINILFNNANDYNRNIFHKIISQDSRSEVDHSVVNAFQMCCAAGPICEEPITNCAFLINDFQVNNREPLDNVSTSFSIQAQLTTMLRDLFRAALEKQQPRIMEPIFSTDIEVTFKILGKVYSVISRRHGKVLDAVAMDKEERKFLVKAQIPVADSDGFANEIRTATSGAANPNLQFSHYEIIDGDPWYKKEDVESDEDDEDTDFIVASNRASNFMRKVRRRKGLQIDDQVVIHAEKQRTLNKKK